MKAIPCPVSPEELRRLVRDEKLTDAEVAARIPGGTIKRVVSWRHRYGIEVVARWERRDLPPIEGKLKSLLVGSMLGDGRIVHRVNAAHYSESHCGDQRDYLAWKAEFWGPWAGPITDVPDKRGYTQVRLTTAAHGDLVPWRDLFYPSRDKGWKRVLPDVVDMVDEFALAVWYMDDGYAGWWPDITFGADTASRGVAHLIFEKFGLRPRWQSKAGNTGAFHMEREDTSHRFIELIRPHVPPCMARKLEFGFQGPHYQVRQRATPERLRELAGQGVPIRRIAALLGVGASTVDRWIVEEGIPHPRKVGRPTIPR